LLNDTEAGAAGVRPPGRAVYWGDFVVNQLDVPVPAEAVKGGNILALASGDAHVLALTKTGKVLVWGYDTPAGKANAAIPSSVTTTGAKAIAAGHYFSVALLKSGVVACWGGQGVHGQPETCVAPSLPTTGSGAVVNISASGTIGLAQAQDGSVYVWPGRWPEGTTISTGPYAIRQPTGISRVEHIREDMLFVWDSKAVLTVRNKPYVVPWPLQQPPPAVSVIGICTYHSINGFYMAAVSSDGRAQVHGESKHVYSSLNESVNERERIMPLAH
jgi:hypothetical protein